MKIKISVLIEKRKWQQLKRISIEKNTDTGTLIENAIAEKYLLALYPAAEIVKLGGIVSSISGLPYVAVLLLYPLVFALIMGISAVLWSEAYARTMGRRATST